MTLTVSTQTHDTTKQLLLLMMIIEVVVEHISLHGDKLNTLSMKDYKLRVNYTETISANGGHHDRHKRSA